MVSFFLSCFSEGQSKYKVSQPDSSKSDRKGKLATKTMQPSSLLSPSQKKRHRQSDSSDNSRSSPRLSYSSSGRSTSSSQYDLSQSTSASSSQSGTLPRANNNNQQSSPNRHTFRSSSSSTYSKNSASSLQSEGYPMSISSSSGPSSEASCSSSSASSLQGSPEPERHFQNEDTDDESPSTARAVTGGFSETNGLVGLRNIGNTCFLNSVMQCLSNTRCLLEYLVKERYTGDINTSSLSTMKGDLIRAFGTLMTEMWTEGDINRALNTGPFKTQIQRFAPTFSGYQQHDAQEFLRKLLEGLHEDVNRVTIRPKPIHTDIDDDLSDDQKAMESWKRYLRFDDSKIVDMFVGQLKSSLQCSHCSHTSVTFDPFWDLSLPIPNKSGTVKLNQCLDLFTKEEVMDGDERPTCSKCKERRRMTKSFNIQKFPKVLVLHLKRFSPTERWRGKLSCTVEFPLETLDLTRYASNSRSSCTYNLIGVANHSGTTYSGHYTAFCRHPYSTQWHEYNDSRVSSIPSRRVCSPEAYVLFYELAGSNTRL